MSGSHYTVWKFQTLDRVHVNIYRPLPAGLSGPSLIFLDLGLSYAGRLELTTEWWLRSLQSK